jgi:chorismate mutase
MKKSRQFYLVAEEILPEAMLKTVKVKEMMARGEVQTINDAVQMVDLSRSAFYKYRDLVFIQHTEEADRLISVFMVLEHRSGILSTVLNTIATSGGNIVTINQGVPMGEIAHITATIGIVQMNFTVEDLIERLLSLPGVRKAEVIGYN